MSPGTFLKALDKELSIKDLTDLEITCLMRVLTKPELGNQLILNEFALIMENFGVPLIDDTVSDEDEFVPIGSDVPRQYALNRMDDEGLKIMTDIAHHLLREFMHPREFFGKSIKVNNEVKSQDRTFKVDTMPFSEFYLKIKIANIRKTLEPNKSLNHEMCLCPQEYPDLINVKNFIRALEDIAEVE
jgi:hypothetical protein